MPRGKPGLTYEEHQELGQELYDIRNKLSAIWTHTSPMSTTTAPPTTSTISITV